MPTVNSVSPGPSTRLTARFNRSAHHGGLQTYAVKTAKYVIEGRSMENGLPYAVLLPIGMVKSDDDFLYEPSRATMDWLMMPGRGRWSGRVLSREDDNGVWHDWLYNFERHDIAILFTLLFYPTPVCH